MAVPIQLWGASDDHTLPPPDNVYLVRDALPKPPDFHEVLEADHYDFLPACSESLAMAAPEICRDDGFDRAAFHVRFNDAVVAFFRRTLSGDRTP